jgi:hypothetical protein
MKTQTLDSRLRGNDEFAVLFLTLNQTP